MILDATAIETEDEIGEGQTETADPQAEPQANEGQQEPAGETAEAIEGPSLDPHRVRCVTLLGLPVAVGLLAMQDMVGRWYGGFVVNRDYDTAPHPQNQQDVPDGQPDVEGDGDDGFVALGDALCDACNRANWWLSINSAETDEHAAAAGEALDTWLSDTDPEAMTEAIFDDADPEEKKIEEKKIEIVAAPPAPAPAAPPKSAVTDEAQRHFDDRRHALEKELGSLSIEQAHLKAAIKSNREAVNAATEELESHLLRGPERLPLFDRQPEPATEEEAATEEAAVPEEAPSAVPVVADCPRGGQHDPDDDGDCRKCLEPCGVAGVADEPAGKESWRAALLKNLPGLTPKIVEILEAERLTTVGDWVDWPAAHPGVEYTQIKNPVGGLTENRYLKIAAAVDSATAAATAN